MLGWAEILLILAVLLLIFGPDKLPKLARELGKAVQEFKNASSGLSQAVNPSSSVRKSWIENATADRSRKQIVDIAKKLKIESDGKTTEQITQEILKKIGDTEKIAVNLDG